MTNQTGRATIEMQRAWLEKASGRRCSRRRMLGLAAAAPWLVGSPLLAQENHSRTRHAVDFPPVPPNKKSLARVERVNHLAAECVRLDNEARDAFAQQHPGVQPELKLRLPKSTINAFDWCNLNKVSEAHRQRTGDCWANSATEALECGFLIRDKLQVVLSTQPVLDHLKLHAKAISGSATMAFDYFLRIGTALLQHYPYDGKPKEPLSVKLPYRAVAWGYVSQTEQPPTIAELKHALLTHGPLAVSVLSTPAFHKYRGGLFHEAEVQPHEVHGFSNHVVLLTGWDDTRGQHGAWKIKNSWGEGWGEQGFMWIRYASNFICHNSQWVRAMSRYYPVPAGIHQLIPDARPWPHVKTEQRAAAP
jgi:cathepsin L